MNNKKMCLSSKFFSCADYEAGGLQAQPLHDHSISKLVAPIKNASTAEGLLVSYIPCNYVFLIGLFHGSWLHTMQGGGSGLHTE